MTATVHEFPGLRVKEVEFVRQLKLQAARNRPENPRQAAIDAGYSTRNAKAISERLLTNHKIAAAIRTMSLTEADVGEVEVTAEKVLLDWWGIHTTYVNELVEFRRDCCRHCWGKKFRYQRTPEEMRRALLEHRAIVAKATTGGQKPPSFNRQGGVGFDPRKTPNQKCPECHGDGVGKPFFKDTRNLSAGARRLYAGVKIGASGSIEILTRNQDQALSQVAKHLGMLIDRKEHGKPGEFDNLSREELGAVLVEKLIAAGVAEEAAQRLVSVFGVGESQ